MLTETISLRADENRDDVTLTTYLLDRSIELTGHPRPAVLVCPGGANLACSDREAEPVALFFNSLGYQAFVLRYSVYFRGENEQLARFFGPSEGGSVPIASYKPRAESAYPAPIVDVEKAMLAIGVNADRWNVDTRQVAVCGFSSGGHTAALYAAEWNQPIVREVGGGAHRIRPAAVILGYPVVDRMGPVSGAVRASHDARLRELGDMSDLALFGTPNPPEELRRRASVTCQITRDMPATFIWDTAEDEIVPTSQSLSLALALSSKGVPFELHVFEHGEHGLSLATRATAQGERQVRPDVAQWTQLVRTWLAGRFTIELDG